jgi:hypothetical protein
MHSYYALVFLQIIIFYIKNFKKAFCNSLFLNLCFNLNS